MQREFLRDCLFPRLEAMGPKLSIAMPKIGYMQSGGGCVQVCVEPAKTLEPIALETQDSLTGSSAIIYAHSQSQRDIDNEKGILLLPKFAELGLTEQSIKVETSSPAQGEGNAVLVITEHGNAKMVFVDYGQKNRAPKKVAEIAARHALDYVKSGTATDYYLADQLLVAMALAGKGVLTVNKVTEHIATCLSIIERFLNCSYSQVNVGDKNVTISLTSTGKKTVVDEVVPKEDFLRTEPAPWKAWGKDLIDQDAVEQIQKACSLPNAMRGALMPDAHKGYGLPIGGVLAVKNAVIPYAVGVDIACRMRLTVLDLPIAMLANENRNALPGTQKRNAFWAWCHVWRGRTTSTCRDG